MLWASEVAAGLGPRMRGLGSRGAFVVQTFDAQEEGLRAGRRPGSDGVSDPKDRWGQLVVGDQVRPVSPERGCWPAFYSGLAGARVPVSAWDGLEVLRVLEAAAL